MRADDGVGAEHAVLGGGEMHGAALAAHEAVVALHQLAQHLLDRHPTRERVGMAAIGAEREVPALHRGGKARGHRLLAEGEMARAFDQVLQEQIERALLALADLDLYAVDGQPHLLADVVVDARTGAVGRAGRFFRHERYLDRTDEMGSRDEWKLAFPPKLRQLRIRWSEISNQNS